MENLTPTAGPEVDVFQRVWQRVMGGRDAVPAPPPPMSPELQGDVPCDCLKDSPKEAPSAQSDEDAEQAAQAAPEPQYIPEPPLPTPEQSMRDPAPPSNLEKTDHTASETCTACETSSPVPADVPAPALEQPVPDPAPGQKACPLTPAQTPCHGSDMPQPWEQPQQEPDCTARLRRQVMDALEGWQFYRVLARRARACDARTLNALAGEEHRCARKLSAAYFLATGMRYWPLDLLTAPVVTSYWGALRSRYQAEQRQDMDYRISADDWPDPDMTSLYQTLSEGCQSRCKMLRGLLEADHTV